MEVRNDIVVRWAVVAFGIFVMLMAAVTVVSDPLSTKHKAVSGSSYIGLLMANPIELAAIQDCLCFVPNPHIPLIHLAGRAFNIGKIKGVDVVYVMSGEKTVNAAMAVQILVDWFDIKGIIHYGTAGSANEACYLGDVCVPSHIAFTSSWDWKEIKSEKGQNPELTFGDFDYPQKGQNLLGKIEFTPHQQFSVGKQMEEVFWLQVDPKWLSIASTKLQGLKLEPCVNETLCLDETPKVVYGLRGSTADVLLRNAAYREFLFKQFNVSTIDEESAAVVLTCVSNRVPCVVFRGVSSMAGRPGELPLSIETLSYLGAANALHVAVEFISVLNLENISLSDY